MTGKWPSIAVVLLVSGLAWAGSPASLPPQLAVAAGYVRVLRAAASGTQNYLCQSTPAGWDWTLKGPEAQLRDERGQLVGKHYAGPTWEALDGSVVVGELKAKADSSDPLAIPWLLLAAKANRGEGILAHVSFIQRLETHGGKAPKTGCDVEHRGAAIKVPYSAVYFFFASAK